MGQVPQSPLISNTDRTSGRRAGPLGPRPSPAPRPPARRGLRLPTPDRVFRGPLGHGAGSPDPRRHGGHRRLPALEPDHSGRPGQQRPTSSPPDLIPRTRPVGFGIASLVFGTVLSRNDRAWFSPSRSRIGIALFIAHYASPCWPPPSGFLADLLAAVPSIIFGLWGIQSPQLQGLHAVVDDLLRLDPDLSQIDLGSTPARS